MKVRGETGAARRATRCEQQDATPLSNLADRSRCYVIHASRDRHHAETLNVTVLVFLNYNCVTRPATLIRHPAGGTNPTWRHVA